MIRVVLDAMGGDRAPAAEIDGAALALSELAPDFELILVGKPEVIAPHLDRHPDLDRSRISVVPATEVIGMDEKPLQAIRRKRDSSLVVSIALHAQGKGDAVVSAGNTGAVLAGATVMLGLHEGVERATVATVLPAPDGLVLVLDAGANVDCSPRELASFARLGSVYARDIFGRPRPNVGLLNIGEEDDKGNAVVREAQLLLKADRYIHFIGNIEGRDVVVPHPEHGRIDVVVCDGFVGNIVLKFYESMGKLLHIMLERSDATLFAQPGIRKLARFLDYGEYGGAPLLGVKGIPIICHGSSTPLAIRNAIRTAVESVKADLSGHIAADLAQREAT